MAKLSDLSFGQWLKQQRTTQGLTQAQLAAQVNCSMSALRKIEAGERRASVQMAELLAEAFKIPLGERNAFLKFARGDLQFATGQFNEEVPWQTPSLPRSNLPAPITSLVGRAQSVADVREYLLKANIRLVTLMGPPGIGKTRLSLESARDMFPAFPDGVFFVALASLDDPALIAPAIVQTLGYAETKNHSVPDQLIDGIRDKQMLLVLDNLEHLMDGAAPLVSNLLSACSRLKILATSRESLRIPGEWLYAVPTLDTPKETDRVDLEHASQFPALRLFVERAHAVHSDFSLTADNIQAIASICAQLDGLPLAIELIAARIRLMSPRDLLERLNDQFVMSANGMRADSIRQQTLQNAIGWSYNLLSPEEQNLFAYLSVFAGGFTLTAIESMFSNLFVSKPVRDLVALLLDKSLIQRTSDESGEVRYDMLVTIRQFALGCLRRMDAEASIRNLHLAYFLDLAEQADKQVHGPDQIKWMDYLSNELDNFRTALAWCLASEQTQFALQLFAALAWTWNVRWSRSEAHGWFYKIRAMPNLVKYPETYARILNSTGLSEWRMGNYSEARSLLEESLVIWLGLGTGGELGQAASLVTIGMVARWGDEDNTKAESYFDQSLALFQKHEDEWGVAWNLFHLGIVANDRDQDESALAFLEQSLTLYKELGDPWGIARVSQFLGILYLKLGNYQKAHFYFDQHLSHDERLRFMDGVSIALLNFGELYRLQGDYAQAESYYEKSLTISREYGMNFDIGVNLYNLGLLALQQNDYSKALRYFTESFAVVRTTNEKISARDFLIALAAVASGINQPERAARLFGAAQALFDATDNLFSPFDRAELDRHIQIAREQLGGVGFDMLVNEGRAMRMEQAIAYALDV